MKLTAFEITEQALRKNEWTALEIPQPGASGSRPLKLLTSPLLSAVPGLTHAFTTRLGGTSTEPLEWFNLGRHWPSEESRQDAIANRSRLCSALGLNFSRLVVPGQIHSTRVAWISEPENLPEVDAVATVTPDTPVLLHYADCVPIIIFERELQALCVVHAGWRGTAGGIAYTAVAMLEQVLSVRAENMVAAIGPAIGDCCYPVGPDVAERLSASVEHRDRLIRLRNGKPHPDLKAINAMQLLEAGVSAVDVCPFCTACHPELFYSHRKSDGKTGRQGAIASIKAT